jgi:dephospho-CoA kinase
MISENRNNMIIIGITGTLGAGKGTIVDYLLEKENFKHYSVRGYLLSEIDRRGMERNRDSMVIVANDLRASHSPSYIIDELYKRAQEEGKNCIIESIRTPGEVDSLREKDNFHLVAVDADPKIRYERIQQRKSETDNVSFETFLENETREMTATDPNKQNLRKCIEMADHTFTNDGSIEDLHNNISNYINTIK